MNKRFFAIFLALWMMALLAFPACNATGGGGDTATSGKTEETADSGENTATTEIPDNLPERDFEKYDFRIYIEDKEIAYKDLYVEEENGDILNDIVYQRNKTVEERFNVSIMPVFYKEWGTPGEKAIKAGEDAFDIISSHGMISYQYAGKNLVSDWIANMPYTDLNAVWWNQDVVGENSYFGKIYAITGDITYSMLGYTQSLYFNKRLFQDLNIEYPYNDVKNGTWTLDKFISVSKNGVADLNGDGKMTPGEDRYGFSILNQWGYPVSILYCGGDKIIKKDENNLPVLSVYNERTKNIYDKFFDMLDSAAFVGAPEGNPDSLQIFQNGRSLFFDRGMNGAIMLRAMEDEIGIIPLPKYDAQTPKYYSLVEAGARMITIPVTVTNHERTSIIVEALAAEGYKKITPVFYEVVLKTKYARDEESAEMLDYIKEGAVVDYGYLNDTLTGALGLLGTNLLVQPNRDFASLYEKHEGKALKAIEKLIEENTQ